MIVLTTYPSVFNIAAFPESLTIRPNWRCLGVDRHAMQDLFPSPPPIPLFLPSAPLLCTVKFLSVSWSSRDKSPTRPHLSPSPREPALNCSQEGCSLTIHLYDFQNGWVVLCDDIGFSSHIRPHLMYIENTLSRIMYAHQWIPSKR